jgi:hypothetical protein
MVVLIDYVLLFGIVCKEFIESRFRSPTENDDVVISLK